MNRARSSLVTALCLVTAVVLLGCSPESPTAPSGDDLSVDDSAALVALSSVAGPTSGVPQESITATECWLPSEHPVTDNDLQSKATWKVLCRVHYVDGSGERYRDTTCIGDFAAEPMLGECYRWTPYTDEPAFEDYPAVSAGGESVG